jgi:hypothetical protein
MAKDSEERKPLPSECQRIVDAFDDTLSELAILHLRIWMEIQNRRDLDTVADEVVYLSMNRARDMAESIFLLCEKGNLEDAAIILRSFVELIIDFKWIMRRKEPRSKRYLGWMNVLNYRMLQKRRKRPQLSLFPDDLDRHADAIERLYKDSMRRFRYRKSWSDKSLRKRAQEAGEGDLYEGVYRMLSEYTHLGPTSFEHFMIFTDPDKRHFLLARPEPSPFRLYTSLCYSQYFLLEILMAAVQHYKIGYLKKQVVLAKSELQKVSDQMRPLGLG